MQTRLAIDTPGQLDLDHLRLTEAASNGGEVKSLHRKASGRFYTHELIGRRLAAHISRSLASADHYSVIDPFCGDGRLAHWLLEEVLRQHSPRSFTVALWDIDGEAVKSARESVEALTNEAGVTVEFDLFIGDSFARASEFFGTFDCVITNPPWELLKPDRRETSSMNSSQRQDYVDALRRFDARLAAEYPTAQPAKRFAGWGTNLSRVGTEVALRLTRLGGTCGVVAPSSFFADANSDRLRMWTLENFELSDVDYFPAEARLFEGVDVPCIAFAAIAQKSRQCKPNITTFSPARQIIESRPVVFEATTIRDNGYVLPVAFGPSGAELIQELFHLPRFGSLEGGACTGLWAGREVDETRRERYMCNSDDAPLFLKGVNIRRFGFAVEPTEHVDVNKIKIPASVTHPRIVWRDVARPSQKRRVHATLIPPGSICGNSLGVAYFRDDDPRKLRALLALFASLPFEYQLRSMLSTGHISLTSVRRVHLPELDERAIDELARATEQALEGIPGAEDSLEIAAARAYGIDRNSWETILTAFPKLPSEEAERLMSQWS